MSDDSQDVSSPPSDIDIASLAESTLQQEGTQMESTDGSGQVFPFPFCFRYNGQPWATQIIYSPTPEGATLSAAQLAEQLNALLVQRNFPPLCTVASGSC